MTGARSSSSTALTVRQYLLWSRGQTIPPFVLEVLLSSGRSFYVKEVFDIHEEDPRPHHPSCVGSAGII